MPDIQIFRSGTHTAINGQSITFSAADLQQIATGYNSAIHHAPIVVGHPQMDDPAYGWVAGLRVENDRLVANVDQVDPEFADLVKNGRFKKVSASFYLPDSPRNPAPGTYYLRHVGFLGAQPPAVKGLQDAKFSDTADETITFTEEMPVTKEELDARQKLLDERAAQLQAQEAAFAEQRATARLDSLKSRVASLVASGQLLPRQQGGVLALLTSFQPDSVLAFAEGDEKVSKSPDQVLLDLLATFPNQVTFGEVTKGESSTYALPPIHPSGFMVESGRATLHTKALSYMEAHKMDMQDTGLYVDVVAKLEAGVLK